MSKRVVVIGAGLGGMTTATLLAQAGFQVIVLEKNSHVGGRADIWRSKGFTFDLGPSWYLMPDVFDSYFQLFQKKPSDYLQLKRLNPSYRIYFDSKNFADLSKDMQKNYQLFDSFEQSGGEKLKKYLAESEELYHTAMNEFTYRSYDQLFQLANIKLLTKPSILYKMIQSFDDHVSSYFTSSQAKKILEFITLFLSGSPYNTPAIYSMLSYVDMIQGVYYPKEGFYQLPLAFKKLAQEQGVVFKFNQPVKKIQASDSKAKTVITNKEKYPADIVISNADYQFTETKLLTKSHQTYSKSYWASRTVGPSALMIYLGVSKKIPRLKHHTIVTRKNWQQHFSDIFDHPKWPTQPSYYVSCTSKTDTTIAPKGHENIVILVPVAAGLTDSEKQKQALADQTISHLEKVTKTNISDHIVLKRLFAHSDYTQLYNSFMGTSLGLTHSLQQTAMFRPRHQSKKLSNLYYCGHYTHPGIGTAPSVISGQIVADIIKKQHS